MTLVRAVHAIRRNPGHRVLCTSEMDFDGRPLVRACVLRHAPGDLFEVDSPDELADLIASGAAILVEETPVDALMEARKQ